MFRLFIPLLLLLAALVWSCYAFFIKKDVKQVKSILGFTAFFSIIWIGIYYFLFS